MKRPSALYSHVCFSRCRAQVVGVLGVLAALFLLNLGLLLLLRFVPDTVSVPTKYRWDEFEDVGGRIGDLERQLVAKPLGDRARIGLIVGTSSARAGFSSVELEAQDGLDMHWLVLPGGGPDYADLQYLLAPLRLMRIRPDVVILATHRFLLVNRFWRATYDFPERASILQTSRIVLHNLVYDLMERWQGSRHDAPGILDSMAASFAPVRDCLARNNAFETLSVYARLCLRHGFYAVRFGLFQALSHDSRGLFPSRSYDSELAPHARYIFELNHRDLKTVHTDPVEQIRLSGALNPDNYRVDSVGARAFSELLRFLTDFDAPLYVLLMPERSDARDSFPPESDALLDTLIRDCSSRAPIRRLDATRLMEDSLFPFDTGHLSRPEGQTLFSRRFAKIIGRELIETQHWPSLDDASLERNGGESSSASR